MADLNIELHRLRPEPGDIVLLHLKERYPSEAIKSMLDIFEQGAPEGARLIVLEGGLEITDLNDEGLARVGLQRRLEVP